MPIALTRAVPPTIGGCELTHLERTPIDFHAATAQHAAYERALQDLGCRVERVAFAPDAPDSVFIEDTAVVFDEIAVLTRPGAPSRRSELPAVAQTLERFRPLRRIEPPGTMDGGDVLQVGARVFVGTSSRTNDDGVAQLASIVGPLGYLVEKVRVNDCLHLKSAATVASHGLIIINPDWIDRSTFSDFDVIDVDRAEPFAANVVRVGDVVLCSAEAPRTRRLIEARGVQVTPVPSSELAKAEGALTCCSLLFADRSHRP
jgi:dimethylargininase